MSGGRAVGAVLAAAHELVDALSVAVLAGESDEAVLSACREVERLRRRLCAVEHRVIAALEVRGIPVAAGASSTAVFLRGVLRIDAGEAAARVRAAQVLGPRRGLTGEVLEPVFVHVAAAQAAGQVSDRHAAIVVRTVERLPDAVQAAQGDAIERDLTVLAAQFEPRSLQLLATRLAYGYDQDGVFADAECRQRARGLTLRTRPDGSGTLAGELSAECAQRLLVHFDALAAPVPVSDGQRDPRTAAQRRHDALLAMLELQQRAELLPDTGGVSAVVVVTMSEEAFCTGVGLARTGHGALVPAVHALAWGGGDVRLLACRLTRGRVSGHGESRRLFTRNDRLALTARDGGCTFPGCDAPPARCQIHHIREYRRGGPTRLANAAMLCGYHHRGFHKLGWHPELLDNRIAWRPPRWIDPEQRPRYNHLHDVAVT